MTRRSPAGVRRMVRPPSMSAMPTRTQTYPPTDSPTKLADVVYYLQTNHPTEDTPLIPSNDMTKRPSLTKTEPSSSPTFENVDDRYFAPDDPAGSFFCGNDWNHAITECPHRCPSGEAKQCPNKMSCYAFTPCIGIGTNSPPTAKPTWEPTMKPTPSEYYVLRMTMGFATIIMH